MSDEQIPEFEIADDETIDDEFEYLDEEETRITVVAEDGEVIECEVLLTFDTPKGDQIVVYTDHTEDEEGNTNLYAAATSGDAEVAEGTDETGPLRAMRDLTEEEWDMVDEVMGSLMGE